MAPDSIYRYNKSDIWIINKDMKVISTAELGSLIRSKRKKLGYTQAQLSDYSGLSTSFISNLENGKETTELGKALFLLQLLGLDMIINDRGGDT